MSSMVTPTNYYYSEDSSPAPLSICPKCGRMVKIDGHCECEAIFLVYAPNKIKASHDQCFS